MTAKPRHGLTGQAADAAVDQACRMLRLPTVRTQFPDLAEAAAREQMSYRGFLAELLMAECDDRARRRAERRIKAAGFPAHKTLDGFDLKASQLPRPTFEFLASLEWLDRNDNLCLAGPAGVGKRHLAQALGRAAITADKKVRFFPADQLIEALYRGLADNTVGKLIERLLRHDLIVIDDLGFTALDRVAADHLFRFIAAAYEQRSIAITTNVDFQNWTQFLPDAATATAILDRFLHHCHVIALDGESYRLREARNVITPA